MKMSLSFPVNASVFRTTVSLFAVIFMAGFQVNGMAANLVVMEARGVSLKPGDTIDSERTLTLKEGEKVTLIGENGSFVTLRGPFSDKPMKDNAPAADRNRNLAALVANRQARTSAVGVARASGEMAKLPEPWLLDVAQSGRRCVQEGSEVLIWREIAGSAETISVAPADRSWQVELQWDKGFDRLVLPPDLLINSGGSIVVSRKGEDISLSLSEVPKSLADPLLIASWLFHQGCAQQADAMLSSLSTVGK